MLSNVLNSTFHLSSSPQLSLIIVWSIYQDTFLEFKECLIFNRLKDYSNGHNTPVNYHRELLTRRKKKLFHYKIHFYYSKPT